MDATVLSGGQGSGSPPLTAEKTDEVEHSAQTPLWLAHPCFLYSQSNLIPDWLSEEPVSDRT